MPPSDIKVHLNNGLRMPIIGFGTYLIHGRDVIFNVVNEALKAGYRSFDTAAVYRNEEDIGLALKTYLPKYNLTRQDIFLTSKLDPHDHGTGNVKQAVNTCLKKLGTTYLDLFLIHWPGAGKLQVNNPQNKALRLQSWDELCELHQDGALSAIGVSNYTVRHLQELLCSSAFKPAVNQVEYHPHYVQSDLLQFCKDNDIHLQAYSSLGTTKNKQLLQEPAVADIAKRISRTPAQVLLQWAIQQGIGVIPKSTNPRHIADNINLDFELSAADMNTLNNLPKVEKYAWDPTSVA